MHHITSGGSSETEVNEFTVMPMSAASPQAVTTATPVGKQPRAWRNALVSKVIGAVSRANACLIGGVAPFRPRWTRFAAPTMTANPANRVVRVGVQHGRRKRRHYQARQERRAWRPPWRRLESRLRRLRDGHDGLLPADVAHQHDHARTEARHCRLFRGPEYLPDLLRLRRCAGGQSAERGKCQGWRPNFSFPEEQPAITLGYDAF